MIRVLEFADVINRYDFIDTLVEYADPKRFEMSVCVRSEEHGIAEPMRPRSGKYKLLKGTSRPSIPAAAWKLSRLLKEWEIDVVHAHHYDQAIIAWLATKLYRRTKLVIGRHYSDSLYRLSDKLKSRILIGLEQAINRHAARIIVPSRMIFEILTERQGIDPAKIDIVHYGFAPAKYAGVEASKIVGVRNEFAMDGKFVVANFSRLHEEKGHAFLVEAAAKLKDDIPNLLVICVGEGPERSSIEKQIKELGVGENVKLAGWRTDAMAIMAASDAVVQSTLQEAFSQAMIEALWMSKPLIMTDVSGARDVIRDGENGLIVQKADSSALADAIKRLVADPALGKEMAHAGRELVESDLVIEKKIKEYEQVFVKAVGADA